MNIRLPALAALILSSFPLAYAADSVAPSCSPAGNVTPICGLHAPEDLELLPDGKHLLVSQMPDHANPNSGGLAVMDLATNRVQPLMIKNEFKAGWGETSCNSPLQKLGPHGIHLSKRPDGALQLLVVNHAERESIEMLELVSDGNSYSGVWRGCVVNATGGLHNDVAATPEGGFIATVMMDKTLRAKPDAINIMLSGADTGYLVEWTAAKGMVKLPNSESPFNNGVQVSRDGKFALFNAWTGKQVRQYERETQRVSAIIDLPFYPDNLTLRADGKLVVAGIDELGSWKNCVTTHSDFCMTGFAAAVIDPLTMKSTPLYHAAPGVLAGASVALQLKQTLYIGTYQGDRLLKVALTP
jgi:hypothetical protein